MRGAFRRIISRLCRQVDKYSAISAQSVFSINVKMRKEIESASGDIELSLRQKIGKKLSYILRYGALREGFTVYDGDYVSLDELLDSHFLRGISRSHLVNVLENDKSYRGVKRFEIKEDVGNSQSMVRAAYGRQLEENPYHAGTNVRKLGDLCLDTVAKYVRRFDFQDFSDDFIISRLIHRLRRCHSLNNVTLSCVLTNSLEMLSVEGCYLTPKSLELIRSRCPRLKALSLRGQTFTLNDVGLRRILVGLPELETLNLAGCRSLGGDCLKVVASCCRRLRHLNACGVPSLGDDRIVEFLTDSPCLLHVDIFDYEFGDSRYLRLSVTVARQRQIVLVHRKVTDRRVCPQRALTACLERRGRFW